MKLSFVFIFLFAQTAFSADYVLNTAKASYSVGPVPAISNSNTVSEIICTTSALEFLKYAPDSSEAEMVNVATTQYLDAGKSYVYMSNPVPFGSSIPLDLSEPVPLIKSDLYHKGEPIFLRLTDNDQNIDPAASESILLTLNIEESGETETIILTETGRDTGVFAGYIQSAEGAAVANNGSLSVYDDCEISAEYEDKCGPNGTGTNIIVKATALVDPFGVVFDSSTGELVDGAVVTLMDMSSSQPAIVYGDDGVSIYPSTVTTGATVSDSSGAVYTFSPGYYRFPYLQPGRYRLDVTPPTGYRWPSTASDSDLDSLPGGPFAIEEGSRGEEFMVDPGPALNIDIPADPVYAWLYVTKSASKGEVSIGDFLQYKITVENTSADYEVQNIAISDKMPLGFRYRNGSTKIGGVSAIDPDVSADGRTLSFSVGSLSAGGSAEITYVVEIAAGAKLGNAINTAYATGTTTTGGASVSSNTARASVRVKEDLFSSKAIIMGRVFPNGCGESQGTDGVAGVRIYLEDGRYVVTDKNGMYHFEGLNPGTHVVQVDLVTLSEDYELISCEENSRFAGTPYSQFVDLQGGTMWRADFYLSPKPKKIEEPKVIEPEFIEIKGDVSIELNSVLSNSECGVQNTECRNRVEYEVPIRIGETSLKNMRLTVMLPNGVSYIRESSTLGENRLPEPEVQENILTYRLGDVDAKWEGKIRFNSETSSAGNEGEFTAKAILTFDTEGSKNLRTPLVDNVLTRSMKTEYVSIPPMTIHPHFVSGSAVLSDDDKVELDEVVSEVRGYHIESIEVTGHTDSQRIGKRLKPVYPDNYALSQARARSVAEYLAASLNLDPSQTAIDGKGPDEPVASNENSEGMAQNRRVELRIMAKKGTITHELRNIKDKSGAKTEINEKILNKKLIEPSVAEKEVDNKTMPEFDNAWLNAAKPGLGWAWPYDSYYPPIPSVKIAVKHDPRKKLTLFLDGQEVDAFNLDGTKKRFDGELAVTLWIGISVKEGDNLFEAVEYNDDGTESGRIARQIHYSSPPVKGVLVAEKSRLTADGKNPPVIAVRMTDKDGHPARKGVVGEYMINPPYLPRQLTDDLVNDPLTLSKNKNHKFLIGDDGIALIELQPTAQTGEATIRLKLMSGEQEIKAWLTPDERDWVLVGLAEGTVGYNTVAGNMESLGDSGVDDKYYDDGRLAFFAKGMIKGKWLLTMAYDSEKEGIKENGGLYGTIDPDKYYTLYGDATRQGYEAASARSIYIKIEREKFYALFGDFETGLTVTELSKYSRNLNGFKSEMKGEMFDFNVFASDTNQAFVKDEIRGDGTSGLYRLSNTNIVINSESVTLETRDRFKSEEIISSTSLTRYTDYDIDYDAGTIYFKSPVYSTDEDFNPIYIVVAYESFDTSDMSYNYGGRGAIKLLENKVEIGVTHIHEGQKGGDGDLAGMDARFKLDDKTSIRAEFAATNTELYRVNSNGRAYLAEAVRRSEKLEGKVYLREQEEDFGLGQQNGSESGTRKMGFDGIYRLDEKVSFRTEAYRQHDLSTDAVRDMVEMQARYNEKQYELHGGLRHAEDNLGDGSVENSEQIAAGGSFRILDDRLVLRLDHDQSLISSNENGDFPTRTIMGADYKLKETATFFVAQEFTQGESEDTQTTRMGLKASPWNGGQVSSSLEQQYTENGARVFAVNGLKQGWQVTKKWSMDAGLDRSETISNDDPTADDSGFTAVSMGAAYKEEKWSWALRLEKRDSNDEDKIGVFTGAYGEVKEGLGLAAAFQAFRSESSGADSTDGNLRLSLAHRPKETRWIVLDRLDYIFEEEKGDGFDYDNWRIINNMNANYKPGRRAQVSLQYGAKYVNETIDDDDYSGYTDLMGLEGRYDITKKWDIGLRGSVLHSWEVNQYKYGYGPSVGYNFAKNVWLSVGYNLEGFRDRDFSRADFTNEGPYIKMRMKFDQGTVKDVAKWFSGQ